MPPNVLDAGDRLVRADSARIVADVIRQAIRDGQFRRSFPSDHELKSQFSVSRNTIREALLILRNEGWIRRGPRTGTEVASRPVAHGLDHLRGLREELGHHGRVHNQVRTVVNLIPPPIVARALGLDADEPAIYLERLRFLNDEPVSLDLTYLVSDIGELVLTRDLAAADLFALIEQVTHTTLGRSDVSLTATTADPALAANLDVSAGAPLLLIERLTRLADGRPVDLEYIRLRPDRIHLRGSLLRSDAALDESERTTWPT